MQQLFCNSKIPGIIVGMNRRWREGEAHVRPYVKRFIMQGENGEKRLLQCPISSVITQDVVVVPQIFWQGMEFHKLVLHSAPQVASPISGASQLILLLFLTSIHTLPPPHANCVPIPIPINLPIPHLPHLCLLPCRRGWITLSLWTHANCAL